MVHEHFDLFRGMSGTSCGHIGCTSAGVGSLTVGVHARRSRERSPDFSGGAIGTGFGLGYFFTKDFELGGRETFNYSSFPNGTNWLSTTRATADYHFDLGNLRPFVGAQTGIVHGLHATTSFEIGPEVGVKYDLSSSTFAYGIFEYEWFAKDRKLKGGIREQQYIVSFGLGFRF